MHELATPRAERFHHGSLVCVLDVDRELLEGLALFAVDFAQDDARARYRQLVAFAAHVLEQDRQVQLAAAEHREHVGVGRVVDA